jgi:hypothetical protein
VRLGDRVRGSLSYNLNSFPGRAPDEDPEEGIAGYIHAPSFAAASMVIENPRSGVDLEVISDPYHGALTWVFNNTGLFFDSNTDSLVVWQPARLGRGPDAELAVIEVQLEGPPNRFTGTDLPAQLDLDDWPDALMTILPFLDGDSTRVYCQINSLTPIDLPIVPGDYDGDADADAHDYAVWRATFGPPIPPGIPILDADGNGSGGIDAADYVVWRNGANVGAMAAGGIDGAMNPTYVAVPEPSPLQLTALAILICAMTGRHAFRLPEHSL